MSESQLKNKEGKSILTQLNSGDELILLDEKGKTFSSSEFSLLLSKKINAGSKCVVFVAGGAYGFSDEVVDDFVIANDFHSSNSAPDICRTTSQSIHYNERRIISPRMK